MLTIQGGGLWRETLWGRVHCGELLNSSLAAELKAPDLTGRLLSSPFAKESQNRQRPMEKFWIQ